MTYSVKTMPSEEAKHKELQKKEDMLYGKLAETAITEGIASDKEAKDLLDSI